MNLNILNNVEMGTKGKDFIFSFIEEISQSIKRNNMEKEMLNVEFENDRFTTKYRDMYKNKLNETLINVANQTEDEGEMYYVFAINSQNEDVYNLCLCDSNQIHNVYEINKNDLPLEITIGSVLRKNENDFILDEKTTLDIEEEMKAIKKELLEEQELELENNRIEGHIYEVSEIGADRVWLFDTSLDDEDGVDEIEEIEIPQDVLDTVTEGSSLIYENGQYRLI